MIDIIGFSNGLQTFDTQTNRATNILTTQIGALEYAPTLGIDLAYFLSEDFSFQNGSFKAYLVQILSNYSINVASVLETTEALYTSLGFNLTPSQSNTSLISR